MRLFLLHAYGSKMNIDDVIKGLVTGLLVGFMVMYSLRPQVPYPEWVLRTYEHPWIFIILIGLVVVMSAWDVHAAAVLSIIVVALLLDYYFLGTRSLLQEQHSPAVVEFDRSAFAIPNLHSTSYSLQPAYPLFNNEMDLSPGHPSPF